MIPIICCPRRTQKRFLHVDLIPMFPINDETLGKSIFSDLNASLQKVNKIISVWREKGLEVTFSALDKMKKSLDFCHFIDNYMIFNTLSPTPSACYGPLNFLLDFPGMSKKVFWNSFPFRYLRYLH